MKQISHQVPSTYEIHKGKCALHPDNVCTANFGTLHETLNELRSILLNSPNRYSGTVMH